MVTATKVNSWDSNIGTVYDGDDLSKAERVFDEYVEQSKGGYGRAADEDVTMMAGGEPYSEYDAPEPDVVAENIESWLNGNRTHVRGEVKKMVNGSPEEVAAFTYYLKWITEFSYPHEAVRFVTMLDGRIED